MTKRTSATEYAIVDYVDAHAGPFRALNLAWIRQHWEPEAADFKVLDAPRESIIDHGGYIAIAVRDEDVIGTCALIRMGGGSYELAKMAVREDCKGLGLGEQLGRAVIDRARKLGARRVYLETNAVLTPALNLYRKLGFVELPAQASPYERANVFMELLL